MDSRNCVQSAGGFASSDSSKRVDGLQQQTNQNAQHCRRRLTAQFGRKSAISEPLEQQRSQVCDSHYPCGGSPPILQRGTTTTSRRLRKGRKKKKKEKKKKQKNKKQMKHYHNKPNTTPVIKAKQRADSEISGSFVENFCSSNSH
jgi:hypothetical protein